MDSAGRAALSVALARLAGGERAAQRDVFERVWPAMRDFCKQLLNHSADAEDAAQAALIRLFEQASGYEATRDALSWALEIALWECRTFRQRRARSREEELRPALLEIPDSALTPEASVSRRELEVALQQAVGSLSDDDRAALTNDLTRTNADVTPATWRKRRERALNRLGLLWRSQHGS